MCPMRPDAGVEPGSLLVASPSLGDPNFIRTVVYVLDHHSDRGTVGVVLNRPSDVPVLDVLPKWWELACAPQTVFVGGPVDRGTARCLAELAPGARPADWIEVSPPVGLTNPDADPESLTGQVVRVRVFAGYAGWDSGQLGREIAEGAWLVVAGRPSDVFTDTGVNLWRSVLRRQGGRIAMLSTYPKDARLN